MTRRKLKVYAAQLTVFVIIFGGWQLFTSLKIVDPFFFGQPSGIVSTLVRPSAGGLPEGTGRRGPFQGEMSDHRARVG